MSRIQVQANSNHTPDTTTSFFFTSKLGVITVATNRPDSVIDRQEIITGSVTKIANTFMHFLHLQFHFQSLSDAGVQWHKVQTGLLRLAPSATKTSRSV